MPCGCALKVLKAFFVINFNGIRNKKYGWTWMMKANIKHLYSILPYCIPEHCCTCLKSTGSMVRTMLLQSIISFISKHNGKQLAQYWFIHSKYTFKKTYRTPICNLDMYAKACCIECWDAWLGCHNLKILDHEHHDALICMSTLLYNMHTFTPVFAIRSLYILVHKITWVSYTMIYHA